MRRLLFALLLLAAHGLPAQAPRAEAGPPVRHHWSRTYNRLLRGGDGRYYLFQTRSGNFWNFGQSGEPRGRLLVFGPDLALLGTQRPRAGGRNLRVYEAFPTDDGIRIVGVAGRAGPAGIPLLLCKPDPGGGPSTCDTLANLPLFKPSLQSPRFRVVQSMDSSRTAIAWRPATDTETAENGLTVLLLDRALRPVRPPLFPLSSASEEVLVLGMAIPDTASIVFHLRAFGGRRFLGRANASGHVVGHYDIASHALNPIALGLGIYPLDIRLHQDRQGGQWALGTYAGTNGRRNEVGFYAGRMSSQDSLQDLRVHPFPDSIQAEILLEEGLLESEFRRSFHNLHFDSPDGLMYVLNLRGQARHLQPRTPGGRHLMMLLAMRLDTTYTPRDFRLGGFWQDGRTDYQETWSWRPLVHGGQAYALLSDFAGVRQVSTPLEAKAVLLPLSGDGPLLDAHDPAAQPPFTVLAPRTGTPDGPGRWVFFSRSHNHLRLIRIHTTP